MDTSAEPATTFVSEASVAVMVRVVLAPVMGAGLDPIAAEGVVPSATPPFQTGFPTPTSALETSSSGGSSSLGSGPVAPVDGPQGTPEGALDATTFAGSSSSDGWSAGTEKAPSKTGILSDTRSTKAANLCLIGAAALATLDRLLTEATGFLEGMPLSLPAGALPVAAGSFSGASGGGSGAGSSFELLGALALLSILLLGGKHLWSACEFLKPSAALLPIIERPG